MQITLLPDASLGALILAAGALGSGVRSGMSADVAKRITRLVGDVRACRDDRCADHSGRHRVRRDHLDRVRESARRLLPDLLGSDLRWHANTIIHHLGAGWLDSITVDSAAATPEAGA